MKKIMIAVLTTALFVAPLTAKEDFGVTVDIGGAFTLFSQHYDKRTVRVFAPGVNAELKYGFTDSFGVYGAITSSFWTDTSIKPENGSSISGGHDLVNVTDTQFGFFYGLNLAKGLDMSFGLGLGVGGFSTRGGLTHSTEDMFLGGGLNISCSYMFTKSFGIYGGLSETVYTPIRRTVWLTKNTGSIQKNKAIDGGKIAQAFNAKLGFQLKF